MQKLVAKQITIHIYVIAFSIATYSATVYGKTLEGENFCSYKKNTFHQKNFQKIFIRIMNKHQLTYMGKLLRYRLKSIETTKVFPLKCFAINGMHSYNYIAIIGVYIASLDSYWMLEYWWILNVGHFQY